MKNFTTIKNIIQQAYGKGGVWALLLVTLGFTFSCEDTAKMYGSPSADFEIKVNVVDSTDTPLRNIRVSMLNAYQDKYTDSTGGAQFEFRGSQWVSARFEDIDGLQNGGKFKTLDTTFQFDSNQFDKSGKKGDSWYKGRLKTEVKVMMHK